MRPLLLLLLLFASLAHAQWTPQQSHTTAGLRGIHNVNGSVAWASGSNGTILRTTDGGSNWQLCATPTGADKLDFRAIWAWDARNAIVMSSGPGDQSRVYQTTDGCRTWSLELTNTKKDGFWDAMVFDSKTGVLIGDPVLGRFETYTRQAGSWSVDVSSCAANPDEAAFAASNSSVFVFGPGRYIIGTGGKSGPRAVLSPLLADRKDNDKKSCRGVPVPLASGSETAGVFSIAFRDLSHGIAVGGDYKLPTAFRGTAAWTSDGGHHWTAASKLPHGYRSSVAWFADAGVWIAAGTNGSDISYDDGKTWEPLDNGNWNALSLPFVVGPNGRIAKLDSSSLEH